MMTILTASKEIRGDETSPQKVAYKPHHDILLE